MSPSSSIVVRRPAGPAAHVAAAKSDKLQFVLTGFKQDSECRVFGFEGIAADHSRTAFSVRADLALVRRYGIPIQELPLLCRSVLERGIESLEPQTLVFTEQEMQSCAAQRVAAKEEAARKKKAPRRHTTENLGAAWRVTHL